MQDFNYAPPVKESDVVDNLTTDDATKVLSAKQGKVLNNNLGSPSSASGVTGADAFSKINTLNSNKANFSTALKDTRLPSTNQQIENILIGTSRNIMYLGNTGTIDDVIVQTKNGDVSVPSLNDKFTTFTTGSASIGSDYTANITTNNVKYVKRSDGVVLVYGNFTIGTQIASSSAKAMFTGLPASTNERFPNWVMSEHYQDDTTRRLQMTAAGNLNQTYTQFPIGDYEIIPFMYFAN